MRKLKCVLDRKALQIIYYTFIRPILEYSDVVWDNCTQYEKNKFDKIQLEAARIVTGTTKLVSSLSDIYIVIYIIDLYNRYFVHVIQIKHSLNQHKQTNAIKNWAGKV